ncbi:MAG: hypothetical protein H5U17_08920 [Defluviimonas sp.]|nr:hypothetical protein [Defluviimonas sp.]
MALLFVRMLDIVSSYGVGALRRLFHMPPFRAAITAFWPVRAGGPVTASPLQGCKATIAGNL